MAEPGRAWSLLVLGLFSALACEDGDRPSPPLVPEPVPSASPAGSGGTSFTPLPALGGSSGAPPARLECPNAASAASAANGVRVYSQWDPLGYAPYALSACELVYVAPDGSLWLRDLTDGNERRLDTSDQNPRRPSISGGVVAWEVLVDDESAVRVFHAERTVTLSGNFAQAGEPRVAAGAVVFTAWIEPNRDEDTDVMLYDLEGSRVAVAIGGRAQQRFADVSDEYVVATDFSESPSGVFDGSQSPADIVLLNRKTGRLAARARTGKQAFPLLGKNGALAFLEWSSVHPEPKFGGYTLWLGRVDAAPQDDVLVSEIRTSPSYVRPSLRDDVIDFVHAPSGGVATLYRVDVATPAVLVPVTVEGTPLGPVALPYLTILGTRLDAGVELRVIPR